MKSCRMVWIALVALLALAALAPAALGQSTPSRSTKPITNPQPDKQGLDVPVGQLQIAGHVRVGDGAPDFTAPSSSGRDVALSRLRGDWILLVFAENREDFGPLHATQENLVDVGVRMYGLCKDKAYRLRAYAESEGLPFELLADDTGEISALYGYYDNVKRASTHGFVLLDRRGVVRLALQGQAPPHQVEELARFTIEGF